MVVLDRPGGGRCCDCRRNHRLLRHRPHHLDSSDGQRGNSGPPVIPNLVLARPSIRALPLVLATLATVVGCQRDKTQVQSGLTGINVTVGFDVALNVSALSISGTVDGVSAFTPGTLPDPPRPLNKGKETAVVLLPPALGGKTVLLRVDGRAGASIVASEQQAVPIQRSKLVNASLTLGAPAICGDGIIRQGIEQCDDGNTEAGDGCSADCQMEPPGSC